MSARPSLVVPVRTGLALALVVAAAQAAGYLGRWVEWVGSWSDTEQANGNAMILSLPAAVGAAAWVSTTARRRRFDGLIHAASRPAWRISGRQAAETWMWVCAGLLIGALPGVVWTAREATFAQPHLIRWLPLLAGGLLACVVGATVGNRLPPVLAAPLLAVGCYVALGFASTEAEYSTDALTLLDSRSMTLWTAPAWVYLAQAAWPTLAAAAVVIRRVHPWRSWAFGMLAGAAAAPLLYVGYADLRPDPAAAVLTCGNDAPGVVVCMPAATARLIPAVSGPAREFAMLLRGLVTRPVVLVDLPGAAVGKRGHREAVAAVSQHWDGQLPETAQVVRFSPMAGHAGEANWVDRDLLIDSLTRTWIRPQPGQQDLSGKNAHATPDDLLRRWVFERLGVPLDGSIGPGAKPLDGSLVTFEPLADEAAWLDGLNPTQRAAWLRAHRDAIRSGTLTLADFQ